MPNCIDPQALRMVYMNNANPNSIQNGQPNSPGYLGSLNAQSQSAINNARNARSAAVNAINNSIRDPNGLPFSGSVSSIARSASQILSAQTARDAIHAVTGKFLSIYDKILGVNSVGQTNLGLQISNRLSYLFKNKKAPIEGWLLLEAPMEGRNAGANDAVNAFRRVDSEAIGYMRDFNDTLFTPFLEKIRPTGDTLGFDNSLAFARMVGDYAVMMHMPEANAYWLQGKQKQLADIQMQMTQARTPNAYAALNRQASKIQYEIDHYNRYKDWIYQVDDHGNGIQCAGRTDGFAREWINNFHQMYNIDRAIMEGYARDLSAIVQTINAWNVAKGNVDPNMAGLIEQNPFQMYVPLKAITALRKGLPTDSTILNAGNFHAREGMDSRTPISNAFDSIYSHASRVAMDNASRDFGMTLAAMYHNAIRQGRNTPIRIENYNTIVAKAQAGGSFGDRNRNILEGREGFMMTFMMPEIDATGQLTLRRKIVTFDDTYVDEAQGVTGHQLNEAMQATQQNTLTRMFGSATGFLGGLNTHYNILFPPVNSLKDAGERLSNLFGQSYKLSDGSMIDGEHFAGAYIAAIPEVMTFLPKVMAGKIADINASPIGRFWQEYITHGIKQEFDPVWHKEGQELNSVMGQLSKDKKLGPVLQMLKGFDDATRRKIVNAIHKYNDYFNNIAAFAQYYALRKNDVTIDSASNGTLEVINLRESGTYSGLLRAAYAFAKPTMQGAASLLRSLGLSPNASGQFKPSAKGIAFFLGQTALFYSLYQMYKNMAGEEKADDLSMDDVSRSIFLPIDKEGNNIKLPIPFGPSPLAATFGIGMDRVMRNKMEPLDFVGHMIRQAFKATTPAEFPGYAMSDGFMTYIGGMFTPSLLQPYFQVVTNKGYHGQQITYGDPNDTTPMYMQGKVTTPSGWTAFARLVNEYSGGALNLAPEQVKVFTEGYLGGIARIIPDAISRESLATMGFDDTTQGILGRAMSTLGASLVYKKIPDTHTQQFYKEYSDLKKEIRGYGIKLSEAGAYSDASGRESVWRDKLEQAGMEDEKIDRYLAMYQAEQEKAKLTKELKKNTVENEDFPDMTHEEIQTLFHEYVDACEALYVDALGIM